MHSQNESISNNQITQTQSESDVNDSKLRLLAESDSLADPQGWPTLNKHIQSKLKSNIASFPQNPVPKLHPQAANQIKNQQNQNPTSTSTTNQENKPSIDQKDSTETATTSLNSRFVPASSSDGTSESTTSQNEPSSSNSNSNSDSREKSSLEDEEIPLNPKNPSTTFHIPGLAPIESSMFFASKRQPGKERNHMWSKTMTKEEIEKEVEDLCLVLDGFRDSPPFTIQRLSELILKPELYHTPTKYLSSIRRVLSVTAERGSFPIPTSTSTIQPPNSNSTPLNSNGINPNGILSSSLHSENSSSQAFHPNSLFQSSTNSKPNGIGEGGSPRIPYTRNNDPIFSPIPFLVKDSLKKDGDGEEEEIPKIELGESRGGQEEKENQVEKVEDGNQPLQESEKVESNQNGEIKMETDSTATRPIDSIPTSTNTSNVSSIDPSASTTTDTTITTHNTPLGVPLGRVDELDDLPKVSLTSTSSETSTSNENKSDQNNDNNADTSSSGRGKLNSDSEIRPISSTTTVSNVNHGDGEREIKRMKSNSSIKVESEPDSSSSISGSGSTSVEATDSLDGDSEMKDGGVKVESTSQKAKEDGEAQEQEKEKDVEKKDEIMVDGEVKKSEEKGKDEMDTS